MATGSDLSDLLGTARLATYLASAGGDSDRARELYLWATDLAGALHSQLSFVELAVRNSINTQLRAWNTTQGYPADWTDAGAAAPELYALLRKQISDARDRAGREASERNSQHPRHGQGITHDDVVAQLMFGAWVKLVRPISRSESSARQKRLWTDVLSSAFPNAPSTEQGRQEIGRQLETVRRLRNRVAHHDNLLEVNVTHRVNGALSLLAKIDPAFPPLASARNSLRRLAREDPRLKWATP